jgi:hypothetical protein
LSFPSSIMIGLPAKHLFERAIDKCVGNRIMPFGRGHQPNG